MTPEEAQAQAAREWAKIEARRQELGQEDRPWNSLESRERWITIRTLGILEEHDDGT